MKKKYGDERRTEIATISGEVDVEDLIPHEDCVITMTEFGYLKRQKLDAYKLQNRGGRGISGMSRRDEDIVRDMFIAETHDNILFFTSEGRSFKLKCYEIPEASRQSRGMNVTNLIPITGDEKVTAMLTVKDFDDDRSIIMLTKHGVIKRVELSAFANIRKNGLNAMVLDEGDTLNWVKLTDNNTEIIVATKHGKAIRYNATEVRIMGRNAHGVRAIKLLGDDVVVGLATTNEGEYLLTASETGFGRISPIDNYRITSRTGQGINNYPTEKFGDVAAISMVDLSDDLILISQDGIIIRIAAETIRITSRTSKGVKIMRLQEGDKLMTLTRTAHEEPEEKSEEDGENAEATASENTSDENGVTVETSETSENTVQIDSKLGELLERAEKDLEEQNSEE